MKPLTLDQIKTQAENLVRNAELAGVTVTVEQKPLKPFAMGNYETVVTVRPVVRR